MEFRPLVLLLELPWGLLPLFPLFWSTLAPLPNAVVVKHPFLESGPRNPPLPAHFYGGYVPAFSPQTDGPCRDTEMGRNHGSREVLLSAQNRSSKSSGTRNRRRHFAAPSLCWERPQTSAMTF